MAMRTAGKFSRRAAVASQRPANQGIGDQRPDAITYEPSLHAHNLTNHHSSNNIDANSR